MLKERARTLAVSIFLLDLTLVAAAFLAAYGIRDALLPRIAPETFPTRLYPLAEYLPLLPLALVIWGAMLLLSGRYRSHRTVPLLDEAWAIIERVWPPTLERAKQLPPELLHERVEGGHQAGGGGRSQPLWSIRPASVRLRSVQDTTPHHGHGRHSGRGTSPTFHPSRPRPLQ